MILELMVAVCIMLNAIVLILLLGRTMPGRLQDFLTDRVQGLEHAQDRLQKSLREALAESREETLRTSQRGREELTHLFRQLVDGLDRTMAQQMERWRDHQAITTERWQEMTAADNDRFAAFARDNQAHHQHAVELLGEAFRRQFALLDAFAKQFAELTAINERRLESMRQTVETKLSELQADNTAKLEQMRATVDEKLHHTLERRFGESFRLVSEHLEQVQKGLGEMQTLAAGVGDLKRVLANVKVRGTMGEVQLESLLEQTLTRDQYRQNVATTPAGRERVDFAIWLPGGHDRDQGIWLPVDAKFPLEDYQRLLDSEEAGDQAGMLDAGKQLEARVRQEARSIREKYVHPPFTTDFAILFVPIEGLFAEILRRPGLWDALQREYRVIVTGPTTISALLNSLQMGFRTLAIEQRSSEVWILLATVKEEFGKFGDILERTQKKLQEASSTIDTAAVRSRAIERKLRSVETLPPESMQSAFSKQPLGGEPDG